MFIRTNSTYEILLSIINNTCGNEDSPLLRIACLIPDSSKVLDIGCGNALFSGILKKF
jgi:tRNA1(Val) A37 N6-methylase TrmN6